MYENKIFSRAYQKIIFNSKKIADYKKKLYLELEKMHHTKAVSSEKPTKCIES